MFRFPPVNEQLALLRRGVEKIVPEDELVEKLKHSRETNIPLRVKYGIDPTGIDVHLGHTVPLRKMRQFQQLGHQAVLIIGNYTALVGDPSGRDETRARLSAEQVEANAVDYLSQVGKVIDLDRTEVVRNGEWFSKMSFAEVLELTSKVTVAQLLTRDDFARRYASESPIYLHECLYPVMQAWDSVEVRSDVELGGTEQLYSFMLARDLQRGQHVQGQVGVMSPILVGLDGKQRMGKSLGNYIGIGEAPYEMMKKFMQLPDNVMRMYFELLTDLPLDNVDRLLAGHPKEAKQTLAKIVIGEYHDAPAADSAADRWQREIGEKELPSEIPETPLSRSDVAADSPPEGTVVPFPIPKDFSGAIGFRPAYLLKKVGLCSTYSDARRVIAQGGAYFGPNKNRIESNEQIVYVKDGLLLWVGKRRFCRIRLVD